jgi:hypothetical protein
MAGGGGQVVSGLRLHTAEIVDGFSQAGLVPDAMEEHGGLLVAGGCGRMIPRQLLRDAQLIQGDSLAQLVTGPFRRGQGGLE